MGVGLCTWTCTIDFCKWFCLFGVVKADLRISIKDYRRNKTLKVLLFRPPFPSRGFMVRTRLRGAAAWQVNGQAWPKGGRTVGLTRVLTALRKTLVRADGGSGG